VSVVLLNEPKVAYRNKRLKFYGCVGISYSRFTLRPHGVPSRSTLAHFAASAPENPSYATDMTRGPRKYWFDCKEVEYIFVS